MRSVLCLVCCLFACLLSAQNFEPQAVSFNDLSYWETPAENWQIVGAVSADPDEDKKLRTKKGTGVLVNLPDGKGTDLYAAEAHGDLDLELEFLLARGSNSGIYLQGRYEIQLYDSWGKRRAGFDDLGGVYAYQAPRINAALAPGLWQKMRIRFEAPKFDAAGKKIANARLLEVELNGITIHQNLELTGPTPGSMDAGEAALGPLRLQGDHGPVAFRNLKLRNYTGTPVTLEKLTWQVTKSNWYNEVPEDRNKLKIDDRGEARRISWEVARSKNDFALFYEGELNVPVAGKHQIWMESNGASALWINNERIFGQNYGMNTKTIDLPAGAVPIRVGYAKNEGWRAPQLGLFIGGENFRRVPLHFESSYMLTNPIPKITTESEGEVATLRSFIDYTEPGTDLTYRLPYAINVGHPERIHFSYNLKNGSLVRVWRGDFLDNTSMWHSRGDGSSLPAGVVIDLSDDPLIARLPDKNIAWPDTLRHEDTDFRYHGYDLDERGHPTFRYEIYGAQVTDRITPRADGTGFERRLRASGTIPEKCYLRLGYGEELTRTGEYLAVDGQRYYLKTAKADVRQTATGAEILLPLREGEIYYEIIF